MTTTPKTSNPDDLMLAPNGGPVTVSYHGKSPEHTILAQTPPANVRRVKIFRSKHGQTPESNRLYWGDNLPILRTLMNDPGVRGKVRLIYIDPPYATNQAFHDNQRRHAYNDDLIGAKYVEELRQRLIFLRELLANDGSIYVHLDSNMAFAIKIIMDEVFGAQNFRNWITRRKCSSKNFTRKEYGNIQDFILYYSKGPDPVWNRAYEDSGLVYDLEDRFPKTEKATGRRYALVPVHAPGRSA